MNKKGRLRLKRLQLEEDDPWGYALDNTRAAQESMAAAQAACEDALASMSSAPPILLEPTPFNQYCASAPFKFVVGKEKLEFIIHSDLVAGQSPKLKALIHGSMRESHENFVIWEETEPEVFHRFGQFLYTASYTGAKPQLRSPQAHAEQSQVACSTSTTKLEPSDKPHLWARFRGLYHKPPMALEGGGSTTTQTVSLDHTAVFLSHAELYVFADYHGIESLQKLTLQHLCHALVEFDLTTAGLEDITQLTRYCFENTTSLNGTSDKLAELIGLYAACHLDHLWKHDAFRDLVEFTDLSDALITMALIPSG